MHTSCIFLPYILSVCLFRSDEMVIKEEQERVRTLLSDTITLLCRNGLTFKSEFNISALIGITLDKDDVFLVDIRETIKNAAAEAEASDAESDALSNASRDRKSHKKRKRRRKQDRGRESESGGSGAESEHEPLQQSDSEEPPQKNIKHEGEEDDEDSQDLVFVKDEPGITNAASSLSFSNAQQISQQTFAGLPSQGNTSGAMDHSVLYSEQLSAGSWGDGSLQSFPTASSTSAVPPSSAAGQPGSTNPNQAAAQAAAQVG